VFAEYVGIYNTYYVLYICALYVYSKREWDVDGNGGLEHRCRMTRSRYYYYYCSLTIARSHTYQGQRNLHNFFFAQLNSYNQSNTPSIIYMYVITLRVVSVLLPLNFLYFRDVYIYNI